MQCSLRNINHGEAGNGLISLTHPALVEGLLGASPGGRLYLTRQTHCLLFPVVATLTIGYQFIPASPQRPLSSNAVAQMRCRNLRWEHLCVLLPVISQSSRQ